MSSQPLNLHDATRVDFPIDPNLQDDDDGLFLPEDPDVIQPPAPSQADFDAVEAITASLKQANEASIVGSGPLLTEDGGVPGDQHNIIHDPRPLIAPFVKPDRSDDTPHPEYIMFSSRVLFEAWIKGESSWCHFVQRRTTTPDKRSVERMRARERAHERSLANLPPEEAASAPPLKKRRRGRTSNIAEKITFTCHHAGSYNPQHSSDLPKEKLRMNTKKTVKCGCQARIVFTEMNEGDCKVLYYWQHQGHDPFAEDEWDTGKLPRVVDDWLMEMIAKGKDLAQIKAALTITEEEKHQLMERVINDPNSLDPNAPPPLAFHLKINYPDIYNRYRKVKGPIKATKVLKGKKRVIKMSQDTSPTPGVMSDHAHIGVLDSSTLPSDATLHTTGPPSHMETDIDPALRLSIATAEREGVAHQFLDERNHRHTTTTTEHHHDVEGDEMPMPMTDEQINEGFAQLAQEGHSDLAQALLRLPRGTIDGDGDDVQIPEEMLRMAGIGEGVVGETWSFDHE
ncbi:hypothetical protein BCR39DRAFT_540463 [Naematelia encephala]|uniref:Uncharacterized protein n=1 Tax=Naematelia encephala TaxID=71784 RepID=A0A1Y2AW68_9TREE|nr:hypothetical protein BCR39DRAFT_540463 [Naematelia encephala]